MTRPGLAYVWVDRYRELGEAGLDDQPTGPYPEQPNLSPAVTERIVGIKKENPAEEGLTAHTSDLEAGAFSARISVVRFLVGPTEVRQGLSADQMYFPTTQWTLLARASLTGENAAGQALEELCRRYWSPLYQFIRARGYPESEAEDLTQGFVLHLLEHATLKKADRGKGRFRSFLLGALMRFLADDYDRRHAQKRGDGAVHVSVDERAEFGGDAALQCADLASEVAFDREWALVILENALRAVQQEIESEKGVAQFTVLRLFLPGSLESPTYEAAAAQLGLSVQAFKSELHRLRRRLKELVRHEVAATVSAPHEIEQEMDHLQRVLMDRGSNLTREAKPSGVNS